MNPFSKIFDKFKIPDPDEQESLEIIRQLRLQSGKMFFGEKVNLGLVTSSKFNFSPLGNSLWLRGSEAGLSSILFHTLTNPQDLIIVVNPTSRTFNFVPFLGMNRVLSVINGDLYSVEVLLDFLYLEILARREEKYLCPHNIFVVMEEQQTVNQELQLKQSQVLSNNSFLKLKELMAAGPSYGIYFHSFYQEISSLPDSLLSLYDYKFGFWLTPPDVKKLNLKPLTNKIESFDYGYNQDSQLLKFPFPSRAYGSNLARELFAEEKNAKKVDVTPSGLLTAPQEVLSELIKSNGLIFNRYSLFKNHKYLPEKYRHLIGAPIEDIAFWDFINQGPNQAKK